jgi:Domain of unknown function (DUF4234)
MHLTNIGLRNNAYGVLTRALASHRPNRERSPSGRLPTPFTADRKIAALFCCKRTIAVQNGRAMPADMDVSESYQSTTGAPKRAILWRRNVFVMIVFTFITFGLYYPVWFFRRRTALNRLDSPRKIQAWPFVLLLLSFANRLIVAMVFGERLAIEAPAVDLLFSVLQFAIAILIVVQCFFIKDIVEDHLAGPGDTLLSGVSASKRLSGLMTFFFSIYYLQHVINRDIVTSTPVSTA